MASILADINYEASRSVRNTYQLHTSYLPAASKDSRTVYVEGGSQRYKSTKVEGVKFWEKALWLKIVASIGARSFFVQD